MLVFLLSMFFFFFGGGGAFFRLHYGLGLEDGHVPTLWLLL